MSLTLNSYPKDWDNDVRMNSRYAPFRKKELNPIDYESKMVFWKSLISNCLSDCGCCTFSVDDLEKAFIRNGRKPMCIKEVIDSMLRLLKFSFLICNHNFLYQAQISLLGSLYYTPFKWCQLHFCYLNWVQLFLKYSICCVFCLLVRKSIVQVHRFNNTKHLNWRTQL